MTGGRRVDSDRMGRRVVSRRLFVAGLASAAVVPAVACRSDDRRRPTTSGASVGPAVPLPPPTESELSLGAALRRRRSVRTYDPDPLTDAELGQLLWAGQGITADFGGRTAPSAGALYPLELYAVTAAGVVQYVPAGHHVEVSIDRDIRDELGRAALGQTAVGEAPATIAITAVPARTSAKYGDRAGRYVDLEAGHAAQNILLQAVALDLVAVPIGAFEDDAVRRALALPSGCEPRYLVAIGHPRA